MSIKIFNKIDVSFGQSKYEIIIGRKIVDTILDFLDKKTKDKKILIVSDKFFDDPVVLKLKRQFQAAGYTVCAYSFDGGKGNKNFNEILKVYGLLEENDFARDSTIIAIGGGVIGDLAGFIASTWYRGMNLVHVPTTIMAMVDSSIGGKVAINFRDTINAIGNYYHPILNVMDLDLIDTLPERDYRSGIAEVIKMAIINDVDFFDYINSSSGNILSRNDEDVVKFISRSIEIKINYVKDDVREGSKRLLLNYGHTLGHAIEVSTVINNHESYRHGEGVSIGIMAALNIAENHIDFNHSTTRKIEKAFKLYGLPTSVDSRSLGFERDDLLKVCIRNVKKDKKRKDNKLRLVLANRIGNTDVYLDVPFRIIEKAFDYIVK